MPGTATDDTRVSPNPAALAGDGGFAPGTRVAGRYQIVRFIAAGGVGEVHEAEDLVIGGRVALKTLRAERAGSDEAVKRLRREIALARQVTHPGVCRVHDVGEHEGRVFLTMELLAGETLAARIRRGPLDAKELDRIAAQLVDALRALHAAGIVHRDFKSANVVLRPDGRAVVTDFGLARSMMGGDSSLTGDSGFLGTPSYMAPEQVEGRQATPASDIYALGVVLFEMATGVLPFREDTAMATATARLHKSPPQPAALRPDLEPRWNAAILRCLERDPAARFARVEEVLDWAPGRRWLSRRSLLAAGGAGALVLSAGAWRFLLSNPATTPIRTLALLPVFGDGRPAKEDPRALALTFDLYDALTGLDALNVLSIETAMKIAKVADPVREALTAADAVLRATVTGNGAEWTLDVELLRAADRVEWRARHTRPERQATFLVDDTVSAIAVALGRPAPPTPPDAAVLEAGLYQRYGEALASYLDNRQGGLEAVVAAAPRLSRAWARLAELLGRRYAQRASDIRDAEGAARIRNAADAALAVDPAAALAYAGRGIAAMARWEWAAADADTARALALAPRHEGVIYKRSSYLMLVGRFDEAIALAAQLAMLNPLSADAQDGLAWCLFMARRFREAIPAFERAIAMEEEYPAQIPTRLGFIAVAQSELTLCEDALATIEQVLARSPDDYTLCQIATVYATCGRRDQAVALLRRLERTDVNGFMLGWVHAALGDTEAALPLFEKLVEEHDVHAVLLKIGYLPQPLRAHPRFAALVERVGFPR